MEKQDNSPENHPGIFLVARKERFNSNGHQRVVHASVNRNGHQQLVSSLLSKNSDIMSMKWETTQAQI